MEINTCTVSGNLCRDAELRVTGKGTQMVTFTVACNDRRQNASGQWEDYPNYFDVTAFGKRAERQMAVLKKGVHVVVFGKLSYTKKTDKDGKNRVYIGITAHTIIAPKVPADDSQLFADDLPF